MQNKAFIFTALLSGLGILLFGQKTQANSSFLPHPTTEGSIGPVAMPPLVFSPTTIPDGQYGSAYANQTLTIAGGVAPYTFSVSAGTMPAGISLSADGVLSGKPTAAGTYSFTVTAQDNARGRNKSSGSQAYALVIDQAVLTITADNATKLYGGSLPALMASYRGFVNGNNASSLSSQPALTTTATSSSPAGVYPIVASGAIDPNYSFTYSPGTLTINPASLLVTAIAQKKEYGKPDPNFTYAATGFLNGANSGIFTGSMSRAPGENVGTYPITAGSLSAGSNYTISYTGNYLTIAMVSQQITWTQSLLLGCISTTQVQLTATASSGLPVTYSVSDGNMATVSGNLLTLLQRGTTVVTANQAGDANHTAAPAITDTVSYQASSLITQHWGDAIFFDNSSGDYIAWQWYKNDSLVAGATSPYFSETASLNGQYFVISTNKDGQQVQSCTLTITGGAPIPGAIKVQPNPTKKGALVTITSNYPSTALQGAVLQIIGITGKVQQQLTNVQPSMQVTMPSENGLYIINLLLANGRKSSINVLVAD
jgi:MBG domain (YGX type)/Putative Ig domain